MSIKVSIVVPIYNAEKFLVKCIASILEQSFKNYELILINDGSTDKSELICKKYKEIDRRVKVINKENSGSANSRNFGIELAQGEYICFVDSDDWIENNMLYETLYLAEKYNVDLVISGIKFDRVNSLGQIINSNINNYELSIWNSEEKLRKNIINLFPNALINSSCNKLYKKSLLIENNIKFINTNVGEDTSFNLDVLKYSKGIVVTDKCYYHYMRYETTKTLTSRIHNDAFKRYLEIHRQMNGLFKYWKIYNSLIESEINKTMFSQYFAIIMKIIRADKNMYSRTLKKKMLNEGLKEREVINTFNSNKCFSYKEYILRLIIKKRLYSLAELLLKVK